MPSYVSRWGVALISYSWSPLCNRQGWEKKNGRRAHLFLLGGVELVWARGDGLLDQCYELSPCQNVVLLPIQLHLHQRNPSLGSQSTKKSPSSNQSMPLVGIKPPSTCKCYSLNKLVSLTGALDELHYSLAITDNASLLPVNYPIAH